MKKLVITLLMLLLPALASAAFHVEIKNNLEKKMYYGMYWIDHNYKEIVGPVNIAGGELEAGQSSASDFNFPAGKYIILWRVAENDDCIKIPFIVNPETTKVTLTTKTSKTL